MERPSSSLGEETLPGTGGVESGSGGSPLRSRRAIGSFIAEDYEIEGVLGAGGMGVVYQARHTKLDRRVAIKEVFAEGPEGSDRLLREAMAMAQLDHPNVVRVFDARQLGEQVFIAMEFLPAGTLRTWGQTRRSYVEIIKMYSKAARGLMAAHQRGIVHRDFKPDNVLLTPTGEPKVADFGVARASQDAAATLEAPPASISADLSADLTRTGHVMGTPAYMAPEQFGRYADARSDQFAFCVALYEALYGRRPFLGPTPAELWVQTAGGQVQPPPPDTDVPDRVFRVILKGLAPSAQNRYPDLGRMVGALNRAIKSPVPIIVGALVGGLVVSGVAGMALGASSREPPELRSFGDVSVEYARQTPDVALKMLEIREAVAQPREGGQPESKLADAPRYDPPGVPSGGYNPEGYRTWEGTFVCDTKHQWFQNVQVHTEGTVVEAKEGCEFRCFSCDLSGDLVVDAEADASVWIKSSNLRSTGEVVRVRGHADVMLEGVGFDAKESDPAISISEEADFSLYNSELDAVRPIVATGDAKLTFDVVTLIGSAASLEVSEQVFVKEISKVHYVGTKLANGIFFSEEALRDPPPSDDTTSD